MKTLLPLLAVLVLLSGCISVKEASIENATFNTSGWKSQAGVGQDAIIEATTTPRTDVTGL
jgi:uncharacterized protein YceK